MATTKKAPGERTRRSKLQFPIRKDVHYHCVGRGRNLAAGVGKTIKMSSREVQFTTQQPLRQGDRVQLAVDWPALLDNVCLMKLEICGSVTESLPGAAAVKIARYEFRTRGSALKAAHSFEG